MLIEVEEREGLCLLRLVGRVAVGSDLEYIQRRTDEIKARNYRRVLTDLRDAQFIDSTALGFIVNLYSSVMKDPEARFVLTGANARVQHVLDLTRLSKVIPMAPDYNAALTMVRG